MNFQVGFNVDVGEWGEGSKDVTENVLSLSLSSYTTSI